MVLTATGPSGDRPDFLRTIAVSRWLRCDPSATICGVISPAARALARSSCNSSSVGPRSEEHTSELQSLMRISYAVFCLKKKNTQCLEYDIQSEPSNQHINYQHP